MRAALIVTLAAVALGGCLDSLVSAQCADGYRAIDGACEPIADESSAPPDAGIGAGPDADTTSGACAADQQVCDGECVDTRTDPDHCGDCSGRCESGLCTAGACAGEVAGHIVAIGHDYVSYRAASARVLGNAVALGLGRRVRVTIWYGDADVDNSGVFHALADGMAATGRAWRTVPARDLPPADRADTDAVIILPQRGSAAAQEANGRASHERLSDFVADGGVVIGLAGPGSTTTDWMRGAGLLDVTTGGASTGQTMTVATTTDAVAVGVPSPYHGAAGTTTFTLADGETATVVVRNPDGEPVVVHSTVVR